MEKRKLKEKLQFLQDIINSFFVLRAKGEQLKNSRDLAKNSKTLLQFWMTIHVRARISQKVNKRDKLNWNISFLNPLLLKLSILTVVSHCPSVWKWKETLISRRIFGKKRDQSTLTFFMFRSVTLPHIRKTASTSATPTLSGDIEKTYVLVQKLVLGWWFQSFYFFNCLFSQNSFGVFRDTEESWGKRGDSKGTEIQSIP